jgi:hypothetical protein
MNHLAFVMRNMSPETDDRLSALGVAGLACLAIAGVWAAVSKKKRPVPYMIQAFVGKGIVTIVAVVVLRFVLPNAPMELATTR